MPSSIQHSVESSESGRKKKSKRGVLSRFRSLSKRKEKEPQQQQLDTRERSWQTNSTKSSEHREEMPQLKAEDPSGRKVDDPSVTYSKSSTLHSSLPSSVGSTQRGSRTGTKRSGKRGGGSRSGWSQSTYTDQTWKSKGSTSNRRYRNETFISEPPPARKAAFTGPPRFDWIDIETSAATKIQSIYRKNKVMSDLERAGVTTSAIRNRRRRRKAAERPRRFQISQTEDAPSFFQWCGVGLAFGDATEENDEAYREFQKVRYEERQHQQAVHEASLRKRFLKTKGTAGNVVEAVEVVE